MAMATVIWPSRRSSSTHSKASGQPLEGLAADQGQGLGAQRHGRLAADRVGFSGQALEGGPVTGHALDQVALPRRGLGEVLGPDAAPELGEVVAQRLGTISGRFEPTGRRPIWICPTRRCRRSWRTR